MHTTTRFTFYNILMYFLLFLASFVFLSFKTIYSNIQKRNKFGNLPPGPSQWPILGSLPELTKNTTPTYKWIAKIMKQLESNIVCIRLGSVNVVVVSSSELAREILQKNDDVFGSRPHSMSSEHATYGYLTMGLSPQGQQWEKMRKMYVRDLVSPARLRWLLHKRNEEADNIVSYIYNQCKKNTNEGAIIDLRTTTRQYSANVVRKMLFGKRYFGEIRSDGGPGGAELEHVEAIFTLLQTMGTSCISDYLPFLKFLDYNGYAKILRDAIKVMNKYHNPIIEDRIEQWNKGTIQNPQDLLDIMITLKDKNGEPFLSLDEIKAQCTELFFPSDNPSNIAEWVIAQMINEPKIMQEAIEEIDKIVGKERLIQETDVPHMNYLKACVKESLRLHPVSPFVIPHAATSDSTLAGYFIPKGSQILIYRSLIGRDPNVWDDPTSFKPSRYLQNSGTKIKVREPNLNFIGFSAGKRGCPAIQLGVDMTIMLLGRLLQGFTWKAQSNEKIDLSEAYNGQLSLAQPLHALATPRLPPSTYETCNLG